ncbi:Uncharacterized membrane protein [Arboricoccus pini]|uniref:Uncharacterized membrane protein n=1 Tax=Arboricoccus pini TaxID=1963835 RepID=A0A212R811_9PROT|nr:DUF1003 domain-containing protein [Arboricoccus pini]SNB68304.1 Uncharacterized membrane protein [Arboricoccus pini]
MSEPLAPDQQTASLDEAAHSKRVRCAVSQRDVHKRDAVQIDVVRPELQKRILLDHPGLKPDAYICHSELNRYRSLYVEELLRTEHGELSELDRQVAASVASHETIVADVEHDFDEKRSFADRISDGLATFGGSWRFLISFAVVLMCWMALNALLGTTAAFDPYPFILLNLVLSCLAAVQAPIIMMSQKRQEEKDRLRSLNDYRVNLKAELEIRHLHEKMDHLINRQWQRLAEIQQIQLEMMEETRRRR